MAIYIGGLPLAQLCERIHNTTGYHTVPYHRPKQPKPNKSHLKCTQMQPPVRPTAIQQWVVRRAHTRRKDGRRVRAPSLGEQVLCELEHEMRLRFRRLLRGCLISLRPGKK